MNNIPYPYLPIQPNQHILTPSLQDQGPNPFAININSATKQNNNFRTTLWTGDYLQTTLMSLNPGEDIGLEIHPYVDQFLRIEQGQGLLQMGKSKDNLNYQWLVFDDSAIFIPANTWHNIKNIGNIPLKLYSIYAPPNHLPNTVHHTKAEAMEEPHDIYFGKSPDELVKLSEYLVNEGLKDVQRGVNMRHILQEFITMGILVGKGFTPEDAYKTVEEWERNGHSKLLQQSKIQ